MLAPHWKETARTQILPPSWIVRLAADNAEGKTRCSHKLIHHRHRSLSGFSNLPSVFPNVRKRSLWLVNGYLKNMIASNYENGVGAMGRCLAGNARDCFRVYHRRRDRVRSTTRGERRIRAARAEKAIRT